MTPESDGSTDGDHSSPPHPSPLKARAVDIDTKPELTAREWNGARAPPHRAHAPVSPWHALWWTPEINRVSCYSPCGSSVSNALGGHGIAFLNRFVAWRALQAGTDEVSHSVRRCCSAMCGSEFFSLRCGTAARSRCLLAAKRQGHGPPPTRAQQHTSIYGQGG